MAESIGERVRRAVRTGTYRLTEHAELEREADTILMNELEEAFGSEIVELVEDYPDDPRGPSALFLGFTDQDRPLHVVLSMANSVTVVFVTLYRPDPALWHEWRKRV